MLYCSKLLESCLVHFSHFLNDAKQVLEDKNVILVKEEVIVLRAWVTRLSIRVSHALGTRLCQIVEQGQAIHAGLDLDAITPQCQVQLSIELVGAESILVLLEGQEGAIVAVVSHDEALLLQVELVGDYLESLGIVLNTEWLRAHRLGLYRVRVDDRLTNIDLCVLDLRNRLRKNRAELRRIKEVGINRRTGHLGQEEV